MRISGIYNLLLGFVNNPYPGPNESWLDYHIPGNEVRKDIRDTTREDKRFFFLKEAKTSNHLFEIGDAISKVTEGLKKIFPEKWLHNIVKDKSSKKYNEFISNLVDNGFTAEKAKAIFNYAIRNLARIKNWAYDNEIVGGKASALMSFAVPLGIIRNLISGIDAVPNSIQRAVNFFYAFTSSMRGYYQYSDRVYNRPDDEAAMNRYQANHYGNKVAGSLGTLACFMETKVNPLILPLAGLFSDSKHGYDNLFSLAIIPNLSWWRARMLAHINQEYLTDLLRYLIHKPLAFLGIQASKEALEGIKKRGNIDLSYVIKRHFENLGIKDVKKHTFSNFACELFKNITGSFSKDKSKQIDSAKKAGETIAPFLGYIAFIATSLGTPFRLIFKAAGIQSRIIDFFSSLSLSAQQCIYFFKMVVPEIVGIKKISDRLVDKKFIKSVNGYQLNELKLALNKKKKLTLLGILTFLSSIVNSALKLFKFDDPHFETLKGTTEGLSGDLVSLFFSFRRHTLGFQFRAENPEFYEDEKEENKMADENRKVNDPASNNGELEGQNGKVPVIKALKPVNK